MIELNFILILRIVFIIFFSVYIYRILRDFSMFSEATSGVIAVGLMVILVMTVKPFKHLAEFFSGLFAFLGGGMVGVVSLLGGVITSLIVFIVLGRITGLFRKQAVKTRKAKAKIKREAGEKFLEEVGEKIVKK